MFRYNFIVLFIFLVIHAQTQELVGTVVDAEGTVMEGVSVSWLEQNGSPTYTSANGSFTLLRQENQNQLIIEYMTSIRDTIQVAKAQSFVYIKLQKKIELSGVDVISQKSSNFFSLINPINIETLDKKEFKKAACCSLAESFSTSNTIDLSYSNAVVGNREIQFLGLRGLYTQQLIENRPAFNGILTTLGYDFIPGSWLNQIHIQKGASSAIYGAESMVGAINISLKKPDTDDPVFVNFFGDYHGRTELNLNLNKSWNPYDHSGLYLHSSFHTGQRDHNKDGFADDSKLQRLNGLWRNNFYGEKWEGQFNIQGLYDNREGGQLGQEILYQVKQRISMVDAFGNLGFVGFKDPEKTAGSIYNVSLSEIKGTYGNESFHAQEFNSLVQLFYNQNINADKHNILGGINFRYTRAEETAFSEIFTYNEWITGAVVDYTFKNKIDGPNQFSFGLSQRLDYLQGKHLLFIPRINFRYQPADQWTIRSSIGRGYRTARILSNQLNLFASSKDWIIQYTDPYESSWNTGINLVGKPQIQQKELTINIDAYYTWFQNQLVVDLEQNDQQVLLYNLKGESRALQCLVTLSYPIVQSIQIKIGGKYTKSQTEFIHGLKNQIFIPEWRGLASMDFESRDKKWLINITANFTGQMRLPEKPNYPHALIHNHTGFTKSYVLLQTQINYLLKNWEFYIGAENMTNYTQHQAIIDPENPFGNYFNATEIYAPVSGIKPFAGIRWKLSRK